MKDKSQKVTEINQEKYRVYAFDSHPEKHMLFFNDLARQNKSSHACDAELAKYRKKIIETFHEAHSLDLKADGFFAGFTSPVTQADMDELHTMHQQLDELQQLASNCMKKR